MRAPLPLRSDRLGGLADRLPVPGYNRDAVTVGVAHFGVGGFHRSHQAVYLDRLMNAGAALDWGICGIGVLPGDRAIHEVLRRQDGLYTLVIRDDQRWQARVIGSLVRHLYAPDDPEAVLRVLCAPSTRIVSLTITEGGYLVDPGTGEFSAPAEPGTGAFDFIVAALDRRRRADVEPFTVLSCDNLPGNGRVARGSVLGIAERRDPNLAKWIAAEVSFPTTMVDRITPTTTPADVVELRERVGIEDERPVVCEPFSQWVIEDDFSGGRPPWEDAGVQLVDNVEPYELMKLRLLNAGHQALGYAGVLAGYRYVHKVAADPVFAAFLRGYLQTEARPTLPLVPGVDLDDYINTLLRRFTNATLQDTLARLCEWSSDRIPKWLVPVIHLNIEAGRPCHRGATIIACWARYCAGLDEGGAELPLLDARAAELRAAARRASEQPLAFIENAGLFGDLALVPTFAESYRWALQSLCDRGVRGTLELATAR